ncbi:hypothetical protein Q6291_34765, partial [Klebsiella pneumoniae]
PHPTHPQHINTLGYAAETCARGGETQDVDPPGLAVSRNTAKLSSEIRRQTRVIFPADTQPRAEKSGKARPAPLDENR